LRIERTLQILDGGGKFRISGKSRQHVVVGSAVLHRASRRDTMSAYRLVSFLAVTARFYGPNNELLCGHERKLVGNAAANPGRVHLQAACNVRHENENGVRGEERFRNRETTVRAVVESALEVLHAVCVI